MKAIGLPSQRSPYQKKAEKAVNVTRKAVHGAVFKFLKLFEDTSTPHR
jgi:hypothetical protein